LVEKRKNLFQKIIKAIYHTYDNASYDRRNTVLKAVYSKPEMSNHTYDLYVVYDLRFTFNQNLGNKTALNRIQPKFNSDNNRSEKTQMKLY